MLQNTFCDWISLQFKMFEFLECLKLSTNNNTKIIKSMDLTEVREKITSNAYDCIEECLDDIEWIHHNCYIYFTGECGSDSIKIEPTNNPCINLLLFPIRSESCVYIGCSKTT